MSFLSSVWDVVLWALMFTVFIGYLMALFSSTRGPSRKPSSSSSRVPRSPAADPA